MARTAWMTSDQAAHRLGVKPETLYAYVSRGLIRSERVPGQRRSRFLRADVERHATRSRRGGRAGGLEVVVETELTLLEPGGTLFYRGWDAADAARAATFERVASWLWTGHDEDLPFRADDDVLAVAASIVGQLPRLPPVDSWRALLPVIRGTDPLRDDRRPVAVAATGRTLLATLVEALPLHGIDPGAAAPLADRLWPRLTPAPPSRRRLRVLDATLILLADHELATSTLAARLAASTHADPYLVVEAGLSVLGGSLHGGAASAARALLRDAGADGAGAAEAIGRILGTDRRIPGLGHAVYEHVDPRATVLLELLDAAGDTPPALPAVLDITGSRSLPFPNVDLALAAVAEAYEMIEGATEAVFAAARIVGWLAHAIEEYEHVLRYRTRAAYVGARPGSSDKDSTTSS